LSAAPSTAGVTTRSSPAITFQSSYWNGSANAYTSFWIKGVQGNPGVQFLQFYDVTADKYPLTLGGGGSAQVAVNFQFPGIAQSALGQFHVRSRAIDWPVATLQRFSSGSTANILSFFDENSSALSGVDFAGRFIAPAGTVSNPGYGFGGGDGLYRITTNELVFAINSTQQILIRNTETRFRSDHLVGFASTTTPGNNALDAYWSRLAAGVIRFNGSGGAGGSASILHLIGNSSTPGIAAGSGAGTGPTINVTGSDIAGTITLTAGSSPAGDATIFTVTYANAYGQKPVVVLTPADKDAATLSGASNPFYSDADSSTSAFVVKSNTSGLTASTQYVWTYHVIQATQ
jgi:hypothetical protein